MSWKLTSTRCEQHPDRDGRRSYLRLDRVVELDEADIRREGSVLEPARFSLVVDALRRLGWG